MDEPQEHTPECPYCSTYPCWCHTDASYHAQVINQAPSDAEIEQAYTFFELEQVAA